MQRLENISSRCAAIVKPGEYLIDRWDNKQCEETKPSLLIRCPRCGELYCLWRHFHTHACES